MILIRSLESADLERGFLDCLGSLAPVDLTVSEATAIWSTRTHAGIETLVALKEGTVVGTASLLVERKFIHRGGIVGHIEDVAVHNAFAGQGIGKALLEHLIDLATRRGCYKVILSCHDQFIPFYTKAGFRRYDNGMRLDLTIGKVSAATSEAAG